MMPTCCMLVVLSHGLATCLLQVSTADLGAALREAWRDAHGRQQRGAAAKQAAARLAEATGWDSLAQGLWKHVAARLPRLQAMDTRAALASTAVA